MDSSPSLSPRLNFCSFLMAGASDLFPSIAIDVFQLYPWHFWQYVCKHKGFSDLASCHLAQELSFVTVYQLSIEGVREGATCPWSWALLFYFFHARVRVPLSFPSGEMETSLFEGEKTGRKKGNSPTGVRCQSLHSHMAVIVDKGVLGGTV